MRRGLVLGLVTALALAAGTASGGTAGVRLEVADATVPRGTPVRLTLVNDSLRGLQTGLEYGLHDVTRDRAVEVLGPDEAWLLLLVAAGPGGSLPVEVPTERLAPGRYRVAKAVDHGGAARTLYATFTVTP